MSDPLDAPLDVLAPPPPLLRRLLKLLLIPLALPLLVLLSPLAGLAALAGLSWLAVARPELLCRLPRDVRFVVRLVRATRQLNRRLSGSRGTFTTADYWAETVARHSSWLKVPSTLVDATTPSASLMAPTAHAAPSARSLRSSAACGDSAACLRPPP